MTQEDVTEKSDTLISTVTHHMIYLIFINDNIHISHYVTMAPSFVVLSNICFYR